MQWPAVSRSLAVIRPRPQHRILPLDSFPKNVPGLFHPPVVLVQLHANRLPECMDAELPVVQLIHLMVAGKLLQYTDEIQELIAVMDFVAVRSVRCCCQ